MEWRNAQKVVEFKTIVLFAVFCSFKLIAVNSNSGNEWDRGSGVADKTCCSQLKEILNQNYGRN
jgi:hypothetical protein